MEGNLLVWLSVGARVEHFSFSEHSFLTDESPVLDDIEKAPLISFFETVLHESQVTVTFTETFVTYRQ